MKRTVLSASLVVLVAGCASAPGTSATIAEQTRAAPIESVRVTVANVEIPVTVASIPLHSSLNQNSPTREHIRKLLLSTT